MGLKHALYLIYLTYYSVDERLRRRQAQQRGFCMKLLTLMISNFYFFLFLNVMFLITDINLQSFYLWHMQRGKLKTAANFCNERSDSDDFGKLFINC